MIKLIIFDWDDVFTLGSTDGYIACYRAAINDVGVHLDPEEELKRIKARWGAPHEEELGELLKEKPELVAQASKRYEKHLFDGTFVGHLSMVKGSIETLEVLSKKYTLAIASGVNPKLLREQIFPKFGVSPDLFAKIMTVYDVDDPTLAKPHPHINLEIMKALDIKPEQAIMVGDAKGDMTMAKGAGIEPVAVLTGHMSREDAESMNIEHILEDVTELPALLRERN